MTFSFIKRVKKRITCMHLSTRIIFSSAMLLVILLGSLLLVLRSIHHIETEYTEISQKIVPHTLQIFTVSDTISRLKHEFEQVALLPDKIDNTEKYYREAKAAVQNLVHSVGSAGINSTEGVGQQNELDRFYTNELPAKLSEFYNLGRASLSEAANQEQITKFNAANQEFRATIQMLLKQQKILVEQKSTAMRAKLAWLSSLLWQLSIAAILIFLILAWYFHTKLKKDFSVFALFFDRAAKQHVHIDLNDDLIGGFYILAEHANQMVDAIQERTKLMKEYKKAIDASAIVSKSSPKDKITYVNDKFTEIFGFTEKEALGQLNTIVSHPDMSEKVRTEIWTKLKKNQIWRGEIISRAKNGEDCWTLTTIVPIVNHHDELIETIAIRTDITELQEHKEELKTIYRRLDSQDKMGQEFISITLAAIQTPLKNLERQIQMIEKSRGDTGLVEVKESMKQIQSLIAEIKTSSQLTAEIEKTQVENLDLITYLNKFIKNFQALYRSQNIRLQLDLPKTNAMTKVCRDQLSKVLHHLLANTLHYTPSGGQVDIEICEHAKEKFWQIAIHNNGKAIPSAKHKVIFDREKADRKPSHGISLFVVKNILKEMNGKIWLESKPGHGSTFYFTLPKSDKV